MLGKNSRISMAEAQKELEHNAPILLIDARSPEEYASGHIKGAINLPSTDASLVQTKFPMQDSKYFVYCLSGGRSGGLVSYMQKVGYTDVTNIGGISSWKGPLEK